MKFLTLIYLYRRLRAPSAGVVVRSFVVVHHKVSGSNIPRTVWPRITQFCSDIHTNSSTTEPITSLCFPSEDIARENNLRKRRFRQLLVEFLEIVSSERHQIWYTYRGISVPQNCRTRRHLLFPVGCKIQLNTAHTAQKCIKRVCSATESISSATIQLGINNIGTDTITDLI